MDFSKKKSNEKKKLAIDITSLLHYVETSTTS